MMIILVLSFLGIAIVGFAIGFRTGAAAGYDEGVEVGRRLERANALAAFLNDNSSCSPGPEKGKTP